jgi:hypothetical protein
MAELGGLGLDGLYLIFNEQRADSH